MKKIKVSIVSYMNTIPFVYGIEQDNILLNQIELTKDIPSECARKLIEGEVDLGLIPVAALPQINNAQIVSDYCIGAVGKVKSVLLVSEVPFNKIENIYLDYQSRTSVALCKVLCKEHWEISPQFTNAVEGYENKIEGKTAGVIIGDRTFHLNKEYPFQYDLAEEWQKFTSLPFVFACWVSNCELPDEFIESFNNALTFGLKHQDNAIAQLSNNSISHESLREYLSDYIRFELDDTKLNGLNLFLEKLTLTQS